MTPVTAARSLQAVTGGLEHSTLAHWHAGLCSLPPGWTQIPPPKCASYTHFLYWRLTHCILDCALTLAQCHCTTLQYLIIVHYSALNCSSHQYTPIAYLNSAQHLQLLAQCHCTIPQYLITLHYSALNCTALNNRIQYKYQPSSQHTFCITILSFRQSIL